MAETIYDEYRDKTRVFMIKHGLTQLALAIRLGCTQQTVSRWLSSESTLSPKLFDKLAGCIRGSEVNGDE